VKFFPDVCLAVLHCTADLPITSGGGTLRSRGCHDGCYTAAYAAHGGGVATGWRGVAKGFC